MTQSLKHIDGSVTWNFTNWFSDKAFAGGNCTSSTRMSEIPSYRTLVSTVDNHA